MATLLTSRRCLIYKSQYFSLEKENYNCWHTMTVTVCHQIHRQASGAIRGRGRQWQHLFLHPSTHLCINQWQTSSSCLYFPEILSCTFCLCAMMSHSWIHICIHIFSTVSSLWSTRCHLSEARILNYQTFATALITITHHDYYFYRLI